MLNPERDITDLHNPKWKKRTKKFWAGNHHGCGDHSKGCFARYGWQVCMDPKRTGGNLGKLMPLIIDHPVSGQFKTVYTVKSVDEDGDEIETQALKWDVKGWRPPHEAENAEPSESLIRALAETAADEKRRLLEGKVSEHEIQAEVDALLTLIYRANGLEDPALPQTLDIRAEREEARKKKRTKRSASRG